MKIEFLKDFSNKTKGEVCELNKAVASSLVFRKIAKVYKEPKKEVKSKKEE
jgi:hypothetical protein